MPQEESVLLNVNEAYGSGAQSDKVYSPIRASPVLQQILAEQHILQGKLSCYIIQQAGSNGGNRVLFARSIGFCESQKFYRQEQLFVVSFGPKKVRYWKQMAYWMQMA